MYVTKKRFNEFITEGYMSKGAMTLTPTSTVKRIEKAFMDFKKEELHKQTSYRKMIVPAGFIKGMTKDDYKEMSNDLKPAPGLAKHILRFVKVPRRSGITMRWFKIQLQRRLNELN